MEEKCEAPGVVKFVECTLLKLEFEVTELPVD